MKVEIFQEDCIGCGLCAETCPEVFRLNDDDIAEVHGDVTEDLEETVAEARDNCPVDVITTEE